MMNGFGFKPEDFEFFTSVRFVIILAMLFMHFGITFIYAIAGITGIPVEVFEAAEIDGANRLQTFFKVTLPSMRPMLFFITIVMVVDGIGTYDIPNLFGPYDTFRTNLTLMMYMEKQAFAGSYAYDKASAASLILLAIYILFSSVIYFTLIRDKDEARLKKLNRQKEKELARSI
jgi:multiple sugar transport system permease protein